MKVLVSVKRVVDVKVDHSGVDLVNVKMSMAARSAGIKVKSVAELVEKLKDEAKVI